MDSDFFGSGFKGSDSLSSNFRDLRIGISGLLVGIDIWSIVSLFTGVFFCLLRIFSLG